MKAMRLYRPGEPLRLEDVADPIAGPADVVLRVSACGVCRTDLHILEGDLPAHRLPVVPGHEVVGIIEHLGSEVTGLSVGQRVGVPWLAHACGRCPYCLDGRENLCDTPGFTGYDTDGGYAELARAEAAFCLPIPARYGDAEAAPLLCAGLIGYRAYRRAGTAGRLGLVGFGAAAHIIAQVARADGVEVYAFTRPGDDDAKEFARRLGVHWAGGSDERPPQLLDAAIIFAPVGALVPAMLANVRKGGRVVCAGIHMSDIPGFPYASLWEEREIVSVANLTREDGQAFMARAAALEIHTRVRRFPLAQANEALSALRDGRVTGAAVLIP